MACAPALAAGIAYGVEIEAPEMLAEPLRKGLNLIRWQGDPQMTPELLRRVADEAERDAREVAAAEGYFSPLVRVAIDEQARPWRVLVQLAPILGEYLRSCVCSALLPPCPEPAGDNCVPLATLTIRKRDCKILRVCNWSSRKFVTTFPNLQYWLSFLPFVRNLRQAIERACCRPFRKIDNTGVAPGASRTQASEKTGTIRSVSARCFN